MNATDLVALTPAQFAAVIALFLPGFVSLRMDRLIHPGKDQGSAGDLVEILGYSLLNAGVLSWAVLRAAGELAAVEPDYAVLAGLAVLICVAGPLAWPLLFRVGQRWAARKGWVMSPHRTAWDDFFSRKQPCWIVLHLHDGSLIGGYFGKRSIASVGLEAGHIYIEELWELDADGEFIGVTPDTNGALFRPTDYLWVELREDDIDGQ